MSKYLVNQLQNDEDTGYFAIRALFDCSTAAATQIKEANSFDGVTFTDASIVNGMTIFVRFWYTNAALVPQLKVGSSTAYPLRRSSSGGDPVGTTKYTSWLPYSILPVTFLGDCWIIDSINYDPPTSTIPTYFFTCTSAASSSIKTLTAQGTPVTSLSNGLTIFVYFSETNAAASPNAVIMNGSSMLMGAIKRTNTTKASITPITSWTAGSIVPMTYYNNDWYLGNTISAIGTISINNELVVPDTYGNAEITTKIQGLINTRIPDAPSTDGTYIYTANVSGSTATYSWENADEQYAVLLNTVWGSEDEEEEDE